jgi:excisionase family DNA binding protein
MNAHDHHSLPPASRDAEMARASRKVLSNHVRNNRPVLLHVANADEHQSLELPAAAVRKLIEVLDAIAAGHDVTLVQTTAELTTVQAAAALNVSRPFFIKLLDEGRIPYRKVGSHRRIKTEDVTSFKKRIDEERRAVLDQLALDAQEQGMGYPVP